MARKKRTKGADISAKKVVSAHTIEVHGDLNLGSKPDKIDLSEIAKRLGLVTSVGTPVGGLNWKAPAEQRQCVHQLLAYLEDRSVFFKPFQVWRCAHHPFAIYESIRDIRSRITTTIQQMPPNSPAIKHLKRMRSACHRFLIKAAEAESTFLDRPEPQSVAEWGGWYEALYVAIGELRSVVGIELAELCLAFEVEPDQAFLDMLPLPDPEGSNPNETG